MGIGRGQHPFLQTFGTESMLALQVFRLLQAKCAYRACDYILQGDFINVLQTCHIHVLAQSPISLGIIERRDTNYYLLEMPELHEYIFLNMNKK